MEQPNVYAMATIRRKAFMPYTEDEKDSDYGFWEGEDCVEILIPGYPALSLTSEGTKTELEFAAKRIIDAVRLMDSKDNGN